MFLKHLLHVFLEGPNVLDGFEQFRPQAFGWGRATVAARPSCAPDEVENQQAEEESSEPHGKPKQRRRAEEGWEPVIIVILHNAGYSSFSAVRQRVQARIRYWRDIDCNGFQGMLRTSPPATT